MIFPRSSWRGTTIRTSKISGLCLILDQGLLRVRPAEAMRQTIAAGVRFFQYRNKTGSRREIYEISQELAHLARQANVLFVVNDHADIAVAAGADGVHLGQDDLPIGEARKVVGSSRIIGISTHSGEQAVAAQVAGADYIGFGPVFQTATKNAGRIQGIPGIAAVRTLVTIPLIAIGGISSANAGSVSAAGADGVAVISAILSRPDLKEAAEELLEVFGGKP